MKTSPLLVQVLAVVGLALPFALLGSVNEATIKELKLTQFVEPIFPESLRVEGVAEGSVTLAVGHNAAGEPVDILVLRSTHPKLAAAAEEAVRQWRFAPTEGGDGARRLVQLNFKLGGVVVFPTGKNTVEDMALQAAVMRGRVQNPVPLLKSLTPEPRALAQAMPRYPAALVERGLTGTATVSFFIDEEGRVRLPEVVEASEPEFGSAAVEAVLQWRYEPPRDRGRALVVRDQWEFQFQPAG